MELELSRGNTLFFDTAPFIYYLEDHELYGNPVEKILTRVYEEGIQIVSSIITYIEIISYPIKLNKNNLVAKYRDFFTNSEYLSLYPVNFHIAEETAHIRAKYNLKTPDATQVATAIVCGADYILTNDKNWKRIEESKVILLDELK